MERECLNKTTEEEETMETEDLKEKDKKESKDLQLRSLRQP